MKWILGRTLELFSGKTDSFSMGVALALFSFICKTNYRAFCTTITSIKTTRFHLMNFSSNWTQEPINWKTVQSSLPTCWTVISTPQNAECGAKPSNSSWAGSDLQRLCFQTTLIWFFPFQPDQIPTGRPFQLHPLQPVILMQSKTERSFIRPTYIDKEM